MPSSLRELITTTGVPKYNTFKPGTTCIATAFPVLCAAMITLSRRAGGRWRDPDLALALEAVD
ncbi:hypothetical protein GCM10010174_06090 [Kutzneria viridogrisea]